MEVIKMFPITTCAMVLYVLCCLIFVIHNVIKRKKLFKQLEFRVEELKKERIEKLNNK
jgi:heme exporter protein D